MVGPSLDVYIGWDSRSEEAYRVAADSLVARSSIPLRVHRLDAADLFDARVCMRPVIQDSDGRLRDHISNAPQSTGFANARFAVPFVHRGGGPALFVDGDVVFLGDVADLWRRWSQAPHLALHCVQHLPMMPIGAGEGRKMDGQAQVSYQRKNWSSVMLWNTDHLSHHRLTLGMLNTWPGDLLHRFCWLRDSEIGSLPAGWNWLVNVQPRPDPTHLAHFTLGGPWLDGWDGAEHDDLWLAAAAPRA